MNRRAHTPPGMLRRLRLTMSAALLVSCAACGSHPQTGPTAPSDPHLVTVPRSDFPGVTGSARIFTFTRELSYPVRSWTRDSRFVLYDNGGFALQYLAVGEYRGTYEEQNGTVTFRWEGWSIAGPWGATGTIAGDSLTVRYNEIMELSDFENAVYTRTP
jgi:hypothetical protein